MRSKSLKPSTLTVTASAFAIPFGLLLLLTACQPNVDRLLNKTAESESKDKPAAISDADFIKVTARDELTLVKFGATWCPPCRAIDDELKTIEGRLGDVEVVVIDVDVNPELSREFQVNGIPKLMLIRQGEVVDERVGFQSAEKLTKWVNEAKAL
ncbi:MAG: thioredoxin domain-containing protein [Planctomycetota bacterium]